MLKRVDELCQKYGFLDWSWVPVKEPRSFSTYHQWLDAGHHGEMGYLEDHLDKKRHPNHVFPDIKSSIVVLASYMDSNPDHEGLGPELKKITNWISI